MSFLDTIPSDKQALFQSEFFAEFIDKQGLGALTKPDIEALIVSLILKYGDESEKNAYSLGRLLKMKESKIRSLMELAEVKYPLETDDVARERAAWENITNQLYKSEIQLESIEKGEIRFLLPNPAHYPYLQKVGRELGMSIKYSKSNEMVIIPWVNLGRCLEHVYDKILKEPEQFEILREYAENRLHSYMEGLDLKPKGRAQFEKWVGRVKAIAGAVGVVQGLAG